MKETWTKIEDWLQENASQIYDSLNEGASDEDFEDLEDLISKRLPDEFKAFYRIHNGQDASSEGLIDTEELLSTERIMDEWQVWKDLYDRGVFDESVSEADDGVKENWWHPLWIPITYDGSGNHYCLDLSPDEGGKKGQIIRIWHDSPERELIADSFTEWINDFAEDLIDGEYFYSEEWGGVISKADVEDVED
ncbi:MAG: SMI1/KNR4 family protein [Bacteroidales bacterium]|nr:SMI1/KNR4 family protein [Bacteroidales bacterium]